MPAQAKMMRLTQPVKGGKLKGRTVPLGIKRSYLDFCASSISFTAPVPAPPANSDGPLSPPTAPQKLRCLSILAGCNESCHHTIGHAPNPRLTWHAIRPHIP